VPRRSCRYSDPFHEPAQLREKQARQASSVLLSSSVRLGLFRGELRNLRLMPRMDSCGFVSRAFVTVIGPTGCSPGARRSFWHRGC